MYRQGMSGTGSNANGNASPLSKPANPIHRDYTGGGQPPPPTVPPMQHAGALESVKRATYHHRSVRKGGRNKETADGRREDAGESREGLSGLR